MDDTVDARGGFAQAAEVGQVAADRLGAQLFDRGGRVFRTRQTEDLVAGLDELGDDSRGDMPAGAGDENTHEWTSEDSNPSDVTW